MTVNPIRVAAVVEYAINTSLAVLNVMADRIWESARQCLIETESLVVDASIKGKRFDFAIKSVAKIVAHAGFLFFVEPIAVEYVVVGRF